MTPTDPLDIVSRTLRTGPASLDQLMAEHAGLWHQLHWQAAQVSLWLACLPAVHRCELPGGESGYALADMTSDTSLADELVALLDQAGRPLPPAQLLGKLPAGRVVTEAMLRAAARQDPRLELKGPLLKLA
jgi:hypothetical protein